MARPDQEAIDTFINITGVSEATAIQKLEEHHGNLEEAINAHFNEGDRNIHQEASFAAPQDHLMSIDDPVSSETTRPRSSLLPFTRDLNPFSLLDPNFSRSMFGIGTGTPSRSPFVSHPRVVREIPIEVKDGNGASGQSRNAPKIEEITETTDDHSLGVRGTVVMDDADEDNGYSDNNTSHEPTTHVDSYGNRDSPTHSGPNARIFDVPHHNNDIEEEMIRAAIEASKHDSAISNQQYEHLDLRDPTPWPVQSHMEDADLAHAVSLSLQTVEREKALREQEGKVVTSEPVGQKLSASEEMGKLTSSNERQSQLQMGSSSIPDEADDVEELPPLIRHRRRRVDSHSTDTPRNFEEVEFSPALSPWQDNNVRHSQRSESDFPSDEWGVISSEERDEAVMLEAAMFGGIPEGSGYHFPYAPHQLMENGSGRAVGSYPRRIVRPPSPSLTAQRLIREQQDDEYLAALQADREKELKAKEEAEAALENKRRKEEEIRRKVQEEQEIERQMSAKEASLPQEPKPDEDDAVTLLVRMPDGSRRGRRFRRSDKLQYLFDFIDVGRVVKPGSYRLVRPYPRRAFGDGESTSTLNELGLTSKQEALFLELI